MASTDSSTPKSWEFDSAPPPSERACVALSWCHWFFVVLKEEYTGKSTFWEGFLKKVHLDEPKLADEENMF